VERAPGARPSDESDMEFEALSSPHSESPGNRAGLVLIVDEDPELRRAMREFLVNSGCGVLEARNSYDALFTIAQHGSAINLLITEINLLPVGGIKLADNALRLCPRMQVLCMSGSVDKKGLKHWMNYLNAEFLAKPFSPFQLHEKVFALLGNRLEDATMPVLDWEPAASEPGRHSTNARDPMFWLKEF